MPRDVLLRGDSVESVLSYTVSVMSFTCPVRIPWEMSFILLLKTDHENN